MLRVALLPEITLIGSIENDSAFYWALHYAKLFGSLGWTTFVLIPERSYTDDLQSRMPENSYLVTTGKYDNSIVGMPNFGSQLYELLHPKRGSLQVDLFFTNYVPAGELVQRMQGDCMPKDRVVVWVNDVMLFSHNSPTTNKMMGSSQLRGPNPHSHLEFVGLSYAAADRIVVNSAGAKRAVLDSSRRILSGTAAREVEQRILFANMGFNFSVLDEVVAEVGDEKFQEFTLFFGGRMNALKRPEKVVKAFVSKFASGSSCRIVMTSPKMDVKFVSKLAPKVKELIEFKSKLGKREFLAYARKSHVAIYPSLAEGVSLGTLEMILAGTVVILPRKDWATDMVGTDYRFLFDSDLDVIGFLDYVETHYEECQEYLRGFRAWLREKYEAKGEKLEVQKRFLQQIKEDVHSLVYSTKSIDSSMMSLIRQSLPNLGETFSIDELIEQVIENSEFLEPRHFVKEGTLSMRYTSKLGVVRLGVHEGLLERVPGKTVMLRKLEKTV